jgi:hypothetical protein
MAKLVRLQRREPRPIVLFGNSRKFIAKLNSRRRIREKTLLTVAMEGVPLTRYVPNHLISGDGISDLTSDDSLTQQGETIAQALLSQGYVAQKLDNQLAWGVSQTNEDWWMLLTFIPRPVAQWRLLPAVQDSHQTKLYSIIEQAIGGRQAKHKR